MKVYEDWIDVDSHLDVAGVPTGEENSSYYSNTVINTQTI
jgi:hypothetical protein